MHFNSKEQKSTDSEKQKSVDARKIGVIIVVLILIIGVFFFVKSNAKVDNTPVKFEVLDESVLTQGNLKEWFKVNSDKKGTYTKIDGNDTYAMISYGKTTKPGIGICIEKVYGSSKTEIKYSIIEDNKNKDKKSVKEYTPKMIIKLSDNDNKISFNELK